MEFDRDGKKNRSNNKHERQGCLNRREQLYKHSRIHPKKRRSYGTAKSIINELPENPQDTHQLISADSNDLDQSNDRKYTSDESIGNQSFKDTQEPAAKKKTKTNSKLTQQEFQKLILKQNYETNRLLSNILNNFEASVSATFAHYNEIFELNKNKPN